MKAVVVQMPPKMIRECDELVKAKYYPNRNELIRLAVRDLLLNHRKIKFSLGTARAMSEPTCPNCGEWIDRAEQDKTEGNYHYCGNCHTVIHRCKRPEEKALTR